MAEEIGNRAQSDKSTAMQTRTGVTVAGEEEALFVLNKNLLNRLITDIVDLVSQGTLQNLKNWSA